MLSEKTRSAISTLKGRYPHPRSALLPALYMVQEEQGYVSETSMAEVADLLRLTAADVKSVASFYTMFFKKPVGRHALEICTNLACMARDSKGVVDYICSRLGVGLGQSTADGKFHVEEVECLGQCEIAPMLEVDLEPYGHLDTPEAIDKVLERYN